MEANLKKSIQFQWGEWGGKGLCFWLCKEKIAEEYRFQCTKIKNDAWSGLEASDQKGNFRKLWWVNEGTSLLKKSICYLNQWHQRHPYNLWK